MNRYDLSFLKWFSKHGWRIHRYLGSIEIWTNDDTTPKHRVTSGMLERLEQSGRIVRIFPGGNCVFDEYWGLA